MPEKFTKKKNIKEKIKGLVVASTVVLSGCSEISSENTTIDTSITLGEIENNPKVEMVANELCEAGDGFVREYDTARGELICQKSDTEYPTYFEYTLDEVCKETYRNKLYTNIDKEAIGYDFDKKSCTSEVLNSAQSITYTDRVATGRRQFQDIPIN